MNAFNRPSRLYLIFGLVVVIVASLGLYQVSADSSGRQNPGKPDIGSTPGLLSPPSPTGRPFPNISIIEPGHNSSISGDAVTISVRVTNFNGTSRYSGYIYYYMDVNPPHQPFKPVATEAGTCVATTDTSYTWTNVSPGKHTFSVALVNNDHTPFIPVTADKVIVRVAE